MKTGLIMEGGAMRGMFTAGVTDVFMENNIEFDGAIGVSAGACFGCNYKSKQIGRTIRYNKKYCKDPRYVSFRSLIKTGDIYGVDFCYRMLPDELDVFDVKTFQNNPMEFYVVATDVVNGTPVYHKCELGNGIDLQWLRASAAMPMLSKNVKIDDYLLSDGGTADSIPIKYFESIGYNKNVVILTQPKGYIKKVTRFLPVMKIALRKYPKFLETIKNRPNIYNETIKYIEEKEEKGELLVIRPESDLNIGAVEHDENELERVYQIGRKVGEKYLENVKNYFKKE